MPKTQPVTESDQGTAPPTRPANPWKNPSYPQRTHLHEKAHWQGILDHWTDRIAAARHAPTTIGMTLNLAQVERLLHQMQGARDQIADAARRLPMETDDLYEEDRHRLDEAVAALHRLFARWDELAKAEPQR